MNQHRNHLPADDLAWLAWQYVSGEMTADEATLFENRLGREDAAGQAAREATAQMVELSDAVALAESLQAPVEAAASVAEPATAPTHWAAWAASSAWMAIGAAVAVAAIGLWQPGMFVPEEQPAAQRLPHELASYWAALPDNFEDEEFAVEDGLDATFENGPIDSSLMYASDADGSLHEETVHEGVPSWLLSALEPDNAEEEHN